MPLPNLLSLHSHDTGPRIPPYGYAASAPALSALAGRGMLVRRTFAVASSYPASRA